MLIGCTPSGLVSFVSEVFSGHISHIRRYNHAVWTSGLLDRGDMSMADRGFEIQELVASKGILVNVTSRLGQRKQMSEPDVE